MHFGISSFGSFQPLCSHRSVSLLLLLPALLVVLSACAMASDDETEPEPDTNGNSGAPAPTAEPDQTSVGDLLDRIENAWSEVESIRIVDRVGVVEGEEDDSDAQSLAIEEVVLPDSRRVVQETGGQVVNEQIRIGDEIWMWGTFVGEVAGPELGTDQWVSLDPSESFEDPMLDGQIELLQAPLDPMYSGQISEETQALAVSEAQEEEIDDQTCYTYTWTTEIDADQEVEYRMSLDEQDLPCQMVVASGGYLTVTSFDINPDDIEIEAPEDPEALPDTGE